MKTLYLSILSLALAVPLAQAGEKATCHDSPRYRVVTNSDEWPDFLVKALKDGQRKTPCVYSVEKNDFVIKNENESFLAFHGDLLLLDSGTGPDGRYLIIWNLANRKKVYEGDYSEPYEIKSDTITFWRESGEANNKNCPARKKWEKQGFGAAIETQVTLDLRDLHLTTSPRTRCNLRQ